MKTSLCFSYVLRPLTVFRKNIQCKFIPHSTRGDGKLGENVHRGFQGGRGWGRQPGLFDLPSTSEAPPLLNPLGPRGGVQPVQMPGLHEWGGGDRVP